MARPGAAAAFGAAMLLLVASLPAVQARVERPTWSSGDFWEYAITGKYLLFPGEGRLRMDVEGTEAVTVEGTTYEAYRVRLQARITEGFISFDLPGVQWHRTSDLSILRSATVARYAIGPANVTTYLNVTYVPPLPIVWPLSNGTTWQSTSEVTFATHTVGQPAAVAKENATHAFFVEPEVERNVTAGVFRTTPLRAISMQGSEIAHWSSVAGNHVRQETRDPSGESTFVAELQSYRYAGPSDLGPALFAIVVVALALVAAGVLILRRGRAKRAEQDERERRQKRRKPKS